MPFQANVRNPAFVFEPFSIAENRHSPFKPHSSSALIRPRSSHPGKLVSEVFRASHLRLPGSTLHLSSLPQVPRTTTPAIRARVRTSSTSLPRTRRRRSLHREIRLENRRHQTRRLSWV